jgi:hypothetical protein
MVDGLPLLILLNIFFVLFMHDLVHIVLNLLNEDRVEGLLKTVLVAERPR